jgi:hypothetical protein
MQPFKCPHCGAPPPPGYQPPTGHFGYACIYCRQQSVHGAPEPPPPTTQQTPAIIVVHHSPSSHGADYHNAAMAHVATARSVSWLIWLIVVLVVSLGGAGGMFMRCTRHSAAMSSLVWDGSEPLQCTGNDDIAVTGVEAHFTGGSAIVANGNCHVKCTDCKISAPTAIEASGNAQVTIVNGTIQGTEVLAEAGGNAQVTVTGNVTASGRVKKSANGRVSAPAALTAAGADGSSSSPTSAAAAPPSKKAAATTAKPKTSAK